MKCNVEGKMSKLIDFSLNVDFSISNTKGHDVPNPFKSIITLEINKQVIIVMVFKGESHTNNINDVSGDKMER
jgi:hypothetical protein